MHGSAASQEVWHKTIIELIYVTGNVQLRRITYLPGFASQAQVDMSLGDTADLYMYHMTTGLELECTCH